ncbi:MAG: hypothetical protein M3Z84_09160 [Actinomycetota bacterium]|nr:hypothetical protein [Actinomycetota bacterium]
MEEAAAALRIGRTKAYAMATEWRLTGGRSGLPVVDFGHVLRVPLCQLEALIGTKVSEDDLLATPPNPENESTPAPTKAEPPVPPLTPATAPRRTRRRAHRDQLDLFGPDLPTS